MKDEKPSRIKGDTEMRGLFSRRWSIRRSGSVLKRKMCFTLNIPVSPHLRVSAFFILHPSSLYFESVVGPFNTIGQARGVTLVHYIVSHVREERATGF